MLRLLARRKISRRKRRKLFFYWLITLILVIAFFANTAKFLSGFFSSFTKPQGTKLNFTQFEGEKIIGVILASPLILATFDSQQKEVNIFELPTNLYLELGDKGFFLASKVYNLDSEEGVKLLANSLLTNFKIPIDFYLDFGKENLTTERLTEWREKISQPTSLLWFFQIPRSKEVLKTNITLFDQFKFFWQLRQIRKDKFNIQIMDAGNFEELVLPNGDRAVKVAQEAPTPETVNAFQDLKIAQEGLTVGVYNAAGKEGLGQLVAKTCKNLGIQATVGGEAETNLPTTKILARSELLDSFTVKRLVKTFGGRVEKQVDSAIEDVVILVGADVAKQLLF